MANIVKPTSTSYDAIYDDIITYLSKISELSISDFLSNTTAASLASVMAALYLQLRKKADSNRAEAYIRGAVRTDSIEYLAISQLNYNPYRYIAPQHDTGDLLTATVDMDLEFNSTKLEDYVYGSIEIDSTSYSISVIKNFNTSYDSQTNITTVTGQGGIGVWHTKSIEIDKDEGHLDSFNVINLDEDKYVIDDSDTISISLNQGTSDEQQFLIDAIVITNINEVSDYSESDREKLVLVTTNFYGGLDLNFGDGKLFGNLLLDQNSATFITVRYFVTPGFVANLSFDTLSYSDPITSLTVAEPMINGSEQEDTARIKTLAPGLALSLDKITNAEDMTASFNTHPRVKSAYCLRETNPLIAAYDSTATYSVGDLAVFNDDSQDVRVMIEYISGYPSWVSANITNLDNNATILLYALVDKGVATWSYATTYVNGDIVFYEENYYQTYETISASGSLDNAITPDNDSRWIETAETQFYEPLTQARFETEFYTQYGYDTKLGFLYVKVKPLTSVIQNVTMTVILEKSTDPNALSQSEVDTEVRTILATAWYVLGKKFYLGEWIDSLHEIDEISRVYFESPSSNAELGADEYYIPGTISITYESSDSTSNKFGV